jgi:hypothetical protein
VSASIRRLLEQALESHGLSVQVDRRLPAKVWEQAVGAEVARRARPTVLVGGVLHVLVEDHRWRDQLDALRTTIIARLNARLGRPMVRELCFGLAHAGALAGPRRPQAAVEPGAELPPAGAIALAAERLPDGLRQAFLAAASAGARRVAELGDVRAVESAASSRPA